jgi:hypothetical protein
MNDIVNISNENVCRGIGTAKWIRSCPKCNRHIKYSSEKYRDKSIKHNSFCMSCAKSIDCPSDLARYCPSCHHPIIYKNKSTYLHALRQKDMCITCGINSKRLTLQEFISKALKKHKKKYTYKKANYINGQTKVIITCPLHGDFLQNPNDHLSNRGCPKCIGRNKSTMDFIKQATKIHKNKYDYSLVNYTSCKCKIKIKCPWHGIFQQKSSNHLSGRGCAKCSSSKGEEEIREFLINNKINYIPYYKFKNCLSKKGYPLIFDFYLPDCNTLIEYDGECHFKCGWVRKHVINPQELKYIKDKDKIKTKYAKDNGIVLIRIPYYNFKHIPKILSKLCNK